MAAFFIHIFFGQKSKNIATWTLMIFHYCTRKLDCPQKLPQKSLLRRLPCCKENFSFLGNYCYQCNLLRGIVKQIVEKRHGEPIKFLFLPKMGLLGNQVGNEKNCWLWIMSNFWGLFFHVFMGKNLIFKKKNYIVGSALKSCLIQKWKRFFLNLGNILGG